MPENWFYTIVFQKQVLCIITSIRNGCSYVKMLEYDEVFHGKWAPEIKIINTDDNNSYIFYIAIKYFKWILSFNYARGQSQDWYAFTTTTTTTIIK